MKFIRFDTLITYQSNKALYLALDLIGLLKKRCTGKIMQQLHTLNGSTLIYQCAAIFYPV